MGKDGENTTGMSRAAKKRAKQRNKREKKDVPPTVEDRTEDATASVQKKAKTAPSKSEATAGKPGKKSSKKPVKSSATAADNHDDQNLEDPEQNEVSFPNTPLVEIMLVEQPKTEEKRELLAQLSSKQRAECLLQAIVDPISLETFYAEYWEKKPLFVKAQPQTKHRYDNLLSLQSIKEMSKKCDLFYAHDLNVTKYQKDKHGVKRRVTMDKLPTEADNEATQESGILVDHKQLWKYFDDGCTIRLLCPHKHVHCLHTLLSTLELEMGCMVGANAYLTPPKASQGFAPHSDDIEAFCLQLEGKKRWKVYEPVLKLPRASSEDFTSDDVKDLTEVMDVTLEPGDILYMPRGWIHQACTINDSDQQHSLHLTVSAMQQWAWADLLDVIVPEALESASSNPNSSSLRQGLPRGFLDYMGAAYDDSVDPNVPDSIKNLERMETEDTKRMNGDHSGGEDEESEESPEEEAEADMKAEREKLRKQFQDEAKKRIMKVAKTACDLVDAACDEMGKRFLSDRQPPALSTFEKSLTNQSPTGEEEIHPTTLCRLVRPGIARLVLEDDRAVVYHCNDNAKAFHQTSLSPLEYEMDDGPALEQLLTTLEPSWIPVSDLIHDTMEDKVGITKSLYEEGILAVKNVA